MSHITIKARLILSYGLLAVMFLAISAYFIFSLHATNATFERYVGGVSARQDATHKLREAVDLRAIAARNLVLVTTPADTEVEKAIVVKAHEEVGLHLKALERLARDEDATPESQAFVQEIARIEGQYAPVALKIVDLGLNKHTEEAIAMMNQQCRPLLAALIKVTREFAAFNDKRSADAIVAANARFHGSLLSILAACFGVLGLLVAAGVYMTRSIIGPITEAVLIARSVAAGDLTRRIHTEASDETGQLIAALGEMQENLVKVVERVRVGSDAVASASQEIAHGNLDLSGRTESQASAVEQTAASMEELSSTVKQNADNARQANQLAQSASGVAVKGARWSRRWSIP